MEKKVYSFLQQAAVFAIIMLIANGLAFISPIPMPASVIGMVLLFIGLCTKVVKLEQVEGLGNSLSTVITFLFVPSGISLVNSLGIMQQFGVQIVFVILVATLALLATTGWTGQMTIAHAKEEVGCSDPNCPLQAAIVIPLFSHQQIVGTLKMYFTDPAQLTHVEEQLAEGLGTIFSSQIELGEAEVQSKLLKEAEIKSLQAQVNPHFFFNAINTISALMRKDSEKARKLLLQLSKYFRGNLQGAVQTTIPVSQELEQVKAYLSLEQARFPNRYQVTFDVEEAVASEKVPPYAIQVLVENTIKHAFGSRKENNQVRVVVKAKQHKLHVDVYDNGQGIPEERRLLLGKTTVTSEKGTGTALENLSRRMANLYGSEGCFLIENLETGGSHVHLEIPMEQEELDARINR
ncbi:sensor histidine kinase, lytK [Enterococcus faecalis]|uniref:antiholin-like murein hydrolase modulator LrgA n=1 Tax=Enterococcus faecalis TaxID=1351 RepID=UPI000DFF8301|nr:antiholin-like murein hydrolase modulator LrgA [Enterococcus faecalis]STP99116.1 sensor histidine kinase, lytK [Enterococcus faecalis]